MKNVFIIADDTTGANSSAILNKPLGYNCVSIYTKINEVKENSVYALSTNSRGIEKEQAYKVVKESLETLKGEDGIYNKRVDSTLRGNLGSELDAFLDYFPNKKAIVVASFPSSGRTCENNKLLVFGELLEKTDVAKDPKCPVHTSVVTDLFKQQTSRKIDNIILNDVRSDKFSSILKDKYNKNDIIVIDAKHNSDIDLIAKTCVDLNLDIITVGPGPFTYYYTKNCKMKEAYKFYGLIGSVTLLSMNQMKYAQQHGAYIYELDAHKILTEGYEQYLDDCYKEIIQISNDFLIITSSCLNKKSKLDLNKYCNNTQIPEDISNLINNRIAKLFIDVITLAKPNCVYTSGGDTTVEFLKQAESFGLQMNNQIIPLTVESTILGGPFANLKIVSKGGLIGEDDTLVYIRNFMKVGM
ncbi:four-carbon acid sugar kinase family protein [Candidatus Izemoplasma sp. B36]|uniref:four-carbon acid sugar kinase family protein n=1 Tax=Candidatus Izemoplasma sp. B36 TaxID=3242468 RepID=UPI003556C0B3